MDARGEGRRAEDGSDGLEGEECNLTSEVNRRVIGDSQYSISQRQSVRATVGKLPHEGASRRKVADTKPSLTRPASRFL